MSRFSDRIAGTAARYPDRPALTRLGEGGRDTLTYGALMAEIAGAVAWLERADVRAGDRVALLAANEPRWVAVYLAILTMGAVAVPLDTAYAAPQVAAILTDSGARAVVTSPRYVDVVRAAVGGAGGDPRVLLLTGSPDSPESPDLKVRGSISDSDSPDLKVRGSVSDSVADSDAAVILYTSGTTADPKGVVLTHANLDAERDAILAVLDATEQDVVLGVLPLFHALAEMANLWAPLSIGASVVFLETVNSTTLVGALQTEGITILACVPQFFYLIHQRVTAEFARRGRLTQGMLRALVGLNVWTRDRVGWNPGRRIFRRVHQSLGPRMRLFITGGSRFDPAIARDLYGLGLVLLNGYGLTETSGAATIVRPGDRFTTSVGPPLPGVSVRIAPAAAGTDAPGDPPEDGEILISGPIVMREYWRRPDATAEVLADGWLHTGDRGRLDAEGRLHITGRQKEIIVLSSGKNLYPEELEAHYVQSPFIKELCVLASSRPGDPSSERLHAIVVPDQAVLRERGIVNIRELLRFELEGLSVQLPAHKRLLGYDISLDPLPRTTTGKLKRAEIARRLRARPSDEDQTGRPVTPDEQAWLADVRHAALMSQIAAHVGRGTVHPDDNLELDLGLDSMERVELLTLLEHAENRRVPAEARAAIFTARQLVEATLAAPVAVHAAEAAAAPEPAGAWELVLAGAPDPDLAAELARPKFIRAFLIHLGLRAAAGILSVVLRVRVSGRSELPAAPFIVCPNHQTFFDGFLLAAALPFRAFRHIFFVGAAEFFETPLMAWGARAVNIVRVDPDANLVSAMRAAAAGLSLGKMLVLFPEGERTIDGTPKPFRKGAAILASHLGVPIVPVALDGLYPLWPRGRPFNWRLLVPWRRPHVSIRFGTPLRVSGTDYTEATSRLQQSVATLLAGTSTGARPK